MTIREFLAKRPSVPQETSQELDGIIKEFLARNPSAEKRRGGAAE